MDTVVVRHVLAHNGGHERHIVEHAASLVRPGGGVLLVDVDLTAHRIHPADADWADLQQAYIRFNASRGNDPSIGLHLAELLAAAGLQVRRHQGWYSIVQGTAGMRPPAWLARDAMLAAGCASSADIDRWGDALDRLDRRPDPTTFFFPMFSALGVRR